MQLNKDLFSKAEDIKKQYSFSDSEEKGLVQISDVINQVTYSGEIRPLRSSTDYLHSATGWVYACISVIADEVANIELKLFKKTNNNVTEVFDHPALDLLYKANNFTTKFDLFWSTQQYLELTGEAPWFVSKDKFQQPTELVLLRPDLLSVIPGSQDEYIGGYTYRVSMGKEITFAPEDIIFLKYPDPTSQFRGMGTLSAAAKTVDVDNYSEDFNANFFKNSARPAGLLKTDQKLNSRVLERLRHEFSKTYHGVNNAHKTMILEAGLDFKAMSVSQKDMDFLEQQRFSRDKILSIFRVPKPTIGLTEDVNRANAEATDYIFSKRTIKPKMQRLIEQLNEFYLPMFSDGENLYFDFTDPVPEDKEFKLSMSENGLVNGWLTVNEVRQMQGFDSIGKEGDVINKPTAQVQPIKTIRIEDEHIPGRINARNRVKRQETLRSELLESKISEKLVPIIKTMIRTKAENTVEETNTISPKHLDFWERKVKNVEAYEGQWQAIMKEVFKDQEKTVLSAYNKKEANEDGTLDEETEIEKMVISFAALSKLIIKDGVELAEELLDDNVQINIEKISNAYEKDELTRFSKLVIEETNGQLEKTLAEGIDNGEGIPKLKKRIKEVFKDATDVRAERIARTEAIRASNYAAHKSYEEAGVEEEVWVTGGGNVCQFCAPLDGRTKKIGEDFFKKGDIAIGYQGGALKLDFDDTHFPPLHPHCKCTIVAK